MMGSAPLQVRMDFAPNDIRAFTAHLKQVAPDLGKALRSRLRKVGDKTISAMKSEILSLPVSGKKQYGVRQAIAGSIKTQVKTSARSNGVVISASGGGLGEHRAMLKALNTASFRHPLFGDREHWYEQTGRPYFGAVLGRHKPEMLKAVETALGDAMKALGGRTP